MTSVPRRAALIGCPVSIAAFGAAIVRGADEPSISCGPGAPAAAEITAAPHRDGVHITLVNSTTTTWVLITPRGGSEAKPGTHTVVLQLAPGRHEVACVDPNDPTQDPPGSPGYRARVVSLIVADSPFFTPSDLQCGPKGMRGLIAILDGTGSPLRPAGLVTATLASVRGLRSTDNVRRTGYRSGPAIHMRVFRDGRIIAGADFGYDRTTGTVFSNGTMQCVDDLPVRVLNARRTSPAGTALARIDGDAFVISRTRAMDRALRGQLNRTFRITCRLGSQARTGTGRFRAGEDQAVVLLDTADTSAPATGKCTVLGQGRTLLTFRRFRPSRAF
jgi:hypothetical protein